ncbi:hypothetical protein ZIOFF_003142 [Zingiber officinale]|uniref:Ubiquitin-like domain-containing protein n=1 Tax=Zingiber officinale TaxID=94328 RepID=A0A8J5IMV9_ZINOF|nr:hypothetical protein ZIOFF_003142 [Zingiber officinale]
MDNGERSEAIGRRVRARNFRWRFLATDGDPGGAAAAVGEAAAVTIRVRSSNRSKLSVQTTLESTVGIFKVLLAEKSDVPAERHWLIYKGQILKDDKTLKSYENPPADATAAASRVSGAESSGSNGDGGFGGADFAGSLFPGTGGNIRNGAGSGLLGFGLPNLNQIQQQLGTKSKHDEGNNECACCSKSDK